MSYKTVKVKRYSDIVNEYPAGESILPGAILALQSDGTVNNNAEAGGGVATMVALEDELQGKTTRDAYEAGDVVFCWYVTPGEEVMLNCSNTFDPAIGAYVTTSTTSGQVKAAASGTPGTSFPDNPDFQVIAKVEEDDDSNSRLICRRV
jgi:hypothetical protein